MDTDSEVTVEFKTIDASPDDLPRGATADTLLRRAAGHFPESIAFADPPNRAGFGLGPGRLIGYAEADAFASRIANRLGELGLERGDIVAFQLPNIWESALLIAAAWRAGLAVVPMPMIWRLNEIHHAFAQINPSAVVTIGEFGGHDFSKTMCEAAAQHISVRYIFGIGENLCDGVTPINEMFAGAAPGDPTQTGSGTVDDADDLAIMTWATSESGPFPVPRTHGELLALAQAVVTELQMTGRDVMLNAYPLTSITAVGGHMMAALVTGATLVFHHPFDYRTFVGQLRDRGVTYTAVPRPVLEALKQRGDLDHPDSKLTRIGCVWASPQELTNHDKIADVPVPVFNVQGLGELALIIRRDYSDPYSPALPLGRFAVPGSSPDAEVFLETRVRGSVAGATGHRHMEGELFVRGTTVPGGDFAKAGAMAQTRLKQDNHGFLPTGIRCAVQEEKAGCFRCLGDDAIIYHGGIAVGTGELDQIYSDYPDFLDAAVLPIRDAVMGDRVFAAVVPQPDKPPSLADFRQFLAGKGIASYKVPDQLLIVNAIPRAADGSVIRDQILNQV